MQIINRQYATLCTTFLMKNSESLIWVDFLVKISWLRFPVCYVDASTVQLVFSGRSW